MVYRATSTQDHRFMVVLPISVMCALRSVFVKDFRSCVLFNGILLHSYDSFTGGNACVLVVMVSQ